MPEVPPQGNGTSPLDSPLTSDPVEVTQALPNAALPDFQAQEEVDYFERRKGKKAGKAEARTNRRDYEAPEINIVAMMDIMTILLIYLLKSYASDPVQITPSPETSLPISSTPLAPQEAVQVAITQRVILVENKKVATVQNGRVAAEFKEDGNPTKLFIVPLYDALKTEGVRQNFFAKHKQKLDSKGLLQGKEIEFKGMLTVIADKRIPFRLLTEVLYTAGKAEYGQYKFAVIKQGS